jgi:hypothetical protein
LAAAQSSAFCNGAGRELFMSIPVTRVISR